MNDIFEVGTVISGSVYGEIYGNDGLILLSDGNNTYNPIKIDSLNEKPITVYNYNSCAYGGFELVTIYDFYKKITYEGIYSGFYEISIPEDAKIIIETDSFKSDKIFVIGGFKSLSKMESLKDKQLCLTILKEKPWMVKYMENLDGDILKKMVRDNPTILRKLNTTNKDVILEGVNKNGLLLENVKFQDNDICSAAMNNNRDAIKFAQYQDKMILKQILDKNGLLLEYVKNQDLELCKIAVNNSTLAIKFAQYQDNIMCMQCVKSNGLLLQYVQNKTYDICINAVMSNYLAYKFIQNPSDEILEFVASKDGLQLEFIKNPSYEIISKALYNNPHCICYIKEPTIEMIEYALNRDIKTLAYMREQPIDKCDLLLKQDPLNLQYIHKENQIIELCRYAVKTNLNAFKFAHIQDENLCIYAVSYNGLLLQYVLNQTAKICDIALKNNILAVRYAKYITDENICSIILKNHELLKNIKINNLSEISKKRIIGEYPTKIHQLTNPSSELIIEAITADPHIFPKIEKKYHTQDIIIAAIKLWPHNLRYAAFQNEAICEEAFKCGNSYIMDLIDYNYISQEKCEQMVKDDYRFLEHVPAEKQTESMCLNALTKSEYVADFVKISTPNIDKILVSYDGLLLKNIKNKTKELCDEAIKNNGCAIKYVPQEIINNKLCMTAIKYDKDALKHIKNPTYKMYKKGLLKNAHLLKQIDTSRVPLDLQIKSVLHSTFSLYQYNETYDIPIEVALAALRESPYSVNHYKNKSIQFKIMASLINVKTYKHFENVETCNPLQSDLMDNIFKYVETNNIDNVDIRSKIDLSLL